MTGNKIIADILKTEYGVKNLTPYEEINYEIKNLSDDISRIKITSKTGDSFCCPVYALLISSAKTTRFTGGYSAQGGF